MQVAQAPDYLHHTWLHQGNKDLEELRKGWIEKGVLTPVCSKGRSAHNPAAVLTADKRQRVRDRIVAKNKCIFTGQ